MKYLFLLLVFVAPVARAQNWIEFTNYTTESGKQSAQITSTLTQPLAKGDRFQAYSWTLANRAWKRDDGHWAEEVLGLGFDVSKSMNLSLGFGLETDGRHGRSQVNLFQGLPGATWFVSLENGASGFWYLVEANVTELPRMVFGTEKIGIGFLAQRFVGMGPRVQFQGNKHLRLSVTPIAWQTEGEGRTTVIALQYK